GAVSRLAIRAEERRAPRLDDADDRSGAAARAARTARAGAAVDQKRIRSLALLDVADVGAAAVGARLPELPQREVDRPANAGGETPDLGGRQRAGRPPRIDPGAKQRLAGLDVPHPREQRLIEEHYLDRQLHPREAGPERRDVDPVDQRIGAQRR